MIPIIAEDDTTKLLDACKVRDFAGIRDTALIRLYATAGARLSEIVLLSLEDIDMATESIRIHGKAGKDRQVRFGPKTGRALSRYLRARAKHPGAHLPALWLAVRGGRALQPNGVKLRLRRLIAVRAGPLRLPHCRPRLRRAATADDRP
ncbi:tyrosine-type recombinase/integrase [Saccharopolyspora phatthalungensis]|uniref:Site-specific recombinase XerD n=1 Tax=Saccharopolyspora phatthalungensis TaxID=664693 RepID=A0A840QAP4_9PSEU|nr:tyrosine-type recombinase/integrase [Saccharopolyspora phatthalungensis]MBB5156890.1 site-specific recombinase XerD [Saccharopolyspora phatthalungensis]